MEKDSVTLKVGDPRHLVFWLVFGAAFFGAFYPVLLGLARAWAGSDDHSHGFAVIPLALYFLWQKRSALKETESAGAQSGLLWVVLALFGFVIGRKAEMVTLVSTSLIFFVWGSVIYLFGYRVFRMCLFPLSILFFMVPVPAQLVAAATVPLQLIVTKASVGLAAFLGVPIFSEGNVINLPDQTFEVVQACSGLRSIMALLTLGAVVSYWTLSSNPLRVGLFLLAVPIAVVVNILRVFLLVIVYYYQHIDLSHGTPHTALGLVVFVAALGMFMLAGRGLARWER